MIHRFRTSGQLITVTDEEMAIVWGLQRLPRPRKVQAIKYLRMTAGIGLKEAKDLCEFIVEHAYQNVDGHVCIEPNVPRVSYEGIAPEASVSKGTVTLGGLLHQKLA